jgi:hypothetical protein
MTGARLTLKALGALLGVMGLVGASPAANPWSDSGQGQRFGSSAGSESAPPSRNPWAVREPGSGDRPQYPETVGERRRQERQRAQPQRRREPVYAPEPSPRRYGRPGQRPGFRGGPGPYRPYGAPRYGPAYGPGWNRPLMPPPGPDDDNWPLGPGGFGGPGDFF